MSNFSCYIVEDDLQALSYAQTIIEELGIITIIGNSGSIKEAANEIKQLKPDFIILDVFLEDGSAFDFLKLFGSISFKIIFTTSYAKYAVNAFKYSAIDYLLKPYAPDELKAALKKVAKNLTKENSQLQLQTLIDNLSSEQTPKKLVLKNSDAIHVISVEDILYAQSENNYTTFFLSNDKKILVSKPLKSFDKKLADNHFFRVHQSYLINLNQVSAYNKHREQVLLQDKFAIPVAQSRRKKLIDYLEDLF